MKKRIRQWLTGEKSTSIECTRLHGKQGKAVRLPTNAAELDQTYGPVMRELGKR